MSSKAHPAIFRRVAEHCRPWEEAIDNGYACWIPDDRGVHLLYILDNALRNIALTDFKKYPWQKPKEDRMEPALLKDLIM